MAANSVISSSPQRSGASRIGWWFMGAVSFGILIAVLTALALRLSTPIPLHRLQMVQDIPLPGALPDPRRTSQNPFVPGVAERFDHFDFQALDPTTHLLFIVHTGPNPAKEHAVDPRFDPHKDARTDGNIVVFNTQLNKVVGLINVPQAAGVIVAPDLGRVYAGDFNDGIVYAIDERTFATVPIQLDRFDNPDAMEYDQIDHRIFVADPGISANPDKTANIALQNQNVAVIDALTNRLIGKVQLGIHKPFGDDVGHIQFDPVTHRIFVVTLALHDLDVTPLVVTPPSFLAVIDPVSLTVLSRIRLPDACINPHGLVIDAEQREAFVACINSQNVVRVDLQTMQPFPDATLLPIVFNADIVRLDHPLHLLFVGCAAGISVFDESQRGLKKLGDYFLGGGSHHTIAINEETHIIYLPLPSVGGRPVLRVIRYVANGV